MFGELAAGLFPHADYAVVIQLDDFTGTDFGGFAGFGFAVAADAALGNPDFGLAAAAGEAGEFEQVAQGDVLVAVEGEGLHGLDWCGRGKDKGARGYLKIGNGVRCIEIDALASLKPCFGFEETLCVRFSFAETLCVRFQVA